MAFEEKRAWIMTVVSIGAYVVYLSVIVGRMGDVPVAEVPYAGTMLWTIGGAIVGAIVLQIVAAIFSPRDADKKDVRDRQINRFGEYIGQSFVVAGGIAALILAMLRIDYFWIANAIYLAFVLSSVVGSGAKIAAYHQRFQPW